jgi:hypothetical protein
MSENIQTQFDLMLSQTNVYRIEDLADLKTKPIIFKVSFAKDSGYYMCIFVVSLNGESLINVASSMYESENLFLLLVSEFISKGEFANDMKSYEATDFFEGLIRFVRKDGNAHMNFSFEKEH